MYRIFENVTVQVRNDEIKMIQFDTKQYKMVSFWDISKLYHYMFQFLICTQFLYAKWYQTNNFVLKNGIFLNENRAKSKLHYVNQDSVWKMRWNQYFVYKMIIKQQSPIMTFQICNFNIKMFSKSKFKPYFPENHSFGILSYLIILKSYLIASYHFFVSILRSCPSLQEMLNTCQMIQCMHSEMHMCPLYVCTTISLFVTK